MDKVPLITIPFIAMLLFSGLGAGELFAQDKKLEKEITAVKELSDDASKAVGDIMSAKDKGIPERFLKDAKAIAVFPSVVKAAFIFGGRGGKGLISRRLVSGWSAPAVFKLGGGSAGFQIGASKTEVILLFMTNDSLKHLIESKFEIGADAAAVAGPVGRQAEAATDARLEAQILSYSRSKGLFAGVSIEGSVIRPDNDANKAVYGMEAKEMLTGANKIELTNIPDSTKGFHAALTKFAP